jgi:DNA-binding transcriptional regulator YhcF (GntR family)
MTTINRYSSVPLYYQLKTMIQEKIESGNMPLTHRSRPNRICAMNLTFRAPPYARPSVS